MYILPYEEASSGNHLESENEDENLEDTVKNRDATSPKPFIQLRKVTPTKPRKPLFIDLTIEDEEDDEIENDEISGVTKNSHEKDIKKALIAARRASRAEKKEGQTTEEDQRRRRMNDIIKSI